MFTRSPFPLAAAVGLVAASLLATPALAGEGRSVEVRFGDLDLKADTDVARLHQRIRSATHRVCDNPGMGDLTSRSLDNQCRVAALADAQPKVELAVAAARDGKDYANAGIAVRAAR